MEKVLVLLMLLVMVNAGQYRDNIKTKDHERHGKPDTKTVLIVLGCIFGLVFCIAGITACCLNSMGRSKKGRKRKNKTRKYSDHSYSSYSYSYDGHSDHSSGS